jgi:hypothetical protein
LGRGERFEDHARSAESNYNQLRELNGESKWIKRSAKWLIKLDKARMAGVETKKSK